MEFLPADSCDGHHGFHEHDYKMSGNSSPEIVSLNTYPNPISNSAEIKVATITESKVKVDVLAYDGRILSNLFEGTMSGEKVLSFNAKNLNPGIYLVRLLTDGHVAAVERVVVMK